ncbi:cysteine-rich motor neuron 1 protein [Culicoides brevitarsis]|uniref:cysteine-rich motor neuron 1 protein n=1 Tax=Culicoides brevitarsis TaxID=469753 RepID=UPI00307BFE3E
MAKTKFLCSALITKSPVVTHHQKIVKSENLSFFVILYLLVVMVLGNSVTQAIKCVCNPQECDVIRSEDCPGKGYIVWDPCKCCKMCAKIKGEACGGPGGFSGSCEPPLVCVIKPPIIGTGVCVELPDNLTAPLDDCPNNKISIEAGCDIVNRKCKCWDTLSVCKTQDQKLRWDFKNLEDCELNLQNVVKSELEFDEDYTIPPQSFEYKVGKSKRRKLLKKRKQSDQSNCSSPDCL